MSEEWRWIPGYEGQYEVSSLGGFRTWVVTGKYRTVPRTPNARINPGGYKIIRLFGATKTLHRMIALAFYGPSELLVRHIDDNKSDNSIANLAYGTPSQNMIDMVENGNSSSARKSECLRGHAFDEVNTGRGINANGRPRRYCRICNKAKTDESRARLAALS